MEIKGNEFNGYKIPTILKETTNFNTTTYRELDIMNSLLRWKILSVNTGRDSDDMKHYWLRITLIGRVSRDLGYYDDAMIICGKWISAKEGDQPENDFIGFISGMNDGVGATIYAQLNPVKV